MTIDTSIPIWQVAIVILPATLGGVWALIRMWFRQKDHQEKIKIVQEHIIKLENGLKEINDNITKKNRGVYMEVKKLDSKFQEQRQTMTEIKTMVGLLINNQIKTKDEKN